jgi:hypothetical protein
MYRGSMFFSYSSRSPSAREWKVMKSSLRGGNDAAYGEKRQFFFHIREEEERSHGGVCGQKKSKLDIKAFDISISPVEYRHIYYPDMKGIWRGELNFAKAGQGFPQGYISQLFTSLRSKSILQRNIKMRDFGISLFSSANFASLALSVRGTACKMFGRLAKVWKEEEEIT